MKQTNLYLDDETKSLLKAYSKLHFGTANMSLAIRDLIRKYDERKRKRKLLKKEGA